MILATKRRCVGTTGGTESVYWQENQPNCIQAGSLAEAKQICAEICRNDLLSLYGEVEGNDGSCLDFEFTDCEAWVNQNPPSELQSDAGCAITFTPWDVCASGPIHRTFTLTASLTTSSGSHASASIGGSLAYELGACDAGVCDFTLHNLSGHRSAVQGTVYEVTGGSYPFELQGLDLQSGLPLDGVWHQDTGRLVFSGDGLYVYGLLEDAIVDSISLGSAEDLFYINQVVGDLDDPSDLLSLSALYLAGDASVSLALLAGASGTEVCECADSTCHLSCGNCPDGGASSCHSLCP